MYLGDKIKALRKAKGLTQTALGLLVYDEISESAAQARITRIETGSLAPAAEDIHGIARALQIPVSDLTGLGIQPASNPCLTQHVDRKYPQLQSLYALLELACERDDEFLKVQALKALQEFAAQELHIIIHKTK